jgi:putative oxidoreductase
MAGLTETGGGVLLALGLFTPLAAAVIVSVMFVAAVSAHLGKGFFLSSGGYEYTLVLGVSGLSLAFTGPGGLSLDALLGLHLEGSSWGAAAALVGLVGGAILLGGRRRAPAAQSATA